jgi:hypothetical protein
VSREVINAEHMRITKTLKKKGSPVAPYIAKGIRLKEENREGIVYANTPTSL